MEVSWRGITPHWSAKPTGVSCLQGDAYICGTLVVLKDEPMDTKGMKVT